MKLSFFFCLFLTSLGCFSQTLVEGKVQFKGEPLINATVYLNNTTIGAITDKQGKFSLNVPEGSYELIISYVGFTTQQIPLTTNTYKEPFLIVMKEEANVLDEVVLKPRYDSLRKYHLMSFKENFFGRSALARSCKILNENALQFEYDPERNILNATASSPLKIINAGLGYEIEYELISFTLTSNALAYLGRTKFKLSKGGKAKMKRWKRNRIKAFLGSQRHFVKSLRAHQLKEDGFIVHQFKRIPNPERPSDGQIAYARKFIREYKQTIDFSKNIKTPLTKIDTMILTVRKASLPKNVDLLYKKNVPYKDLMYTRAKDSVLAFENYLSIIYTRAKEEPGYNNQLFSKKQASKVQSSVMVLLEPDAILDPTGDIINPLDILVDGYWGFTGFAQALPLDFQVTESDK